MHSRPASIAELRETALPLLSVQAFKSLMWLGVHGKFAYSAEDEPPSAGDSEDVDVIAVWDPNSERAWHPSHADRHTRLENTLGKAWKREIYLSDITDGKLGDNTHTDAMLFSRTIYGSAQNQLVTKLRKEARAIVDQELDIYSGVSRKVKEMQAWVAATGVEEFKNRVNVRNEFEKCLTSILKDLDFTDRDPRMNNAYCYTILKPANELREELESYRAEPNNTSDPASPYWKAIWLAVSNYGAPTNALSDCAIWINEHIIPRLQDSILASEELHRRDATNSST